MSKLFEWVGTWKLWGVVGAVVAVLFGLLKIQSARLENAKEEQDELKAQIEQGQYNHEVETVNRLNEEDYRISKDKHDEAINDTSKSYTLD